MIKWVPYNIYWIKYYNFKIFDIFPNLYIIFYWEAKALLHIDLKKNNLSIQLC